jgi:5-methylcytosine-specific restriction endonuclease McrA
MTPETEVPMPPEDTKQCRSCEEIKPLGQFGKNSARKDGVHYYCKPCTAERTRQWRKANPEKNRAYKYQWAKTEKGRAMKAREKAKHKERYAEYERRRRAEKPDAIRAQWQRWADRNREHVRAYNREYQRNHPRPSAAQTGVTKESAEMTAVLRRDPCAYCGGKGGEIDHIVPYSKGGENDWTNFTSACGRCNRSKNARPLLTFLLSR